MGKHVDHTGTITLFKIAERGVPFCKTVKRRVYKHPTNGYYINYKGIKLLVDMYPVDLSCPNIKEALAEHKEIKK